MKLSLCINSATADLSKPDAIRHAKTLGFSAIEFWEGGASDFDTNLYKQALDETGITLACMGFASGLVDPSKRDSFLENVKTSLKNAKILGAKRIIATTGQEVAHLTRQEQHDSIVEGLIQGAKILEGTDIVLVLEPLNILVDHKGYYLYTSKEGFEIIQKVNSPNVKLLFDIYHQQITEGNLISNIINNINLIGHFHVAGNPGRNEPFVGEINYIDVFAEIDKTDYKGHAGLEYWPKGDRDTGLKRCIELYEK